MGLYQLFKDWVEERGSAAALRDQINLKDQLMEVARNKNKELEHEIGNLKARLEAAQNQAAKLALELTSLKTALRTKSFEPSAEEDSILQLLAESDENLSIEDIATRSGLGNQSIRLHLERLKKARFIEEFRRTSGFGGGPPIYALSAPTYQLGILGREWLHGNGRLKGL